MSLYATPNSTRPLTSHAAVHMPIITCARARTHTRTMSACAVHAFTWMPPCPFDSSFIWQALYEARLVDRVANWSMQFVDDAMADAEDQGPEQQASVRLSCPFARSAVGVRPSNEWRAMCGFSDAR